MAISRASSALGDRGEMPPGSATNVGDPAVDIRPALAEELGVAVEPTAKLFTPGETVTVSRNPAPKT